jgi:hypothetical protein
MRAAGPATDLAESPVWRFAVRAFWKTRPGRSPSRQLGENALLVDWPERGAGPGPERYVPLSEPNSAGKPARRAASE